MRDAHRMKEKFDLSLDNRQIVSLLIGGIVVLGAVFVLGVVVGKKLAGNQQTAEAPDLLTALDQRAEVPLTFQDELTKKTTPLAPPPVETAPAPVAVVKPEKKPGPAPEDDKPEVAAARAEPVKVEPVKAEPEKKPEVVAAAAVAKPEKPTVPAVSGKIEDDQVPTNTSDSGLKNAFARVAKPTEAKTGGAWTLQLSASQSKDEADKFAARMRDRGYAPFIVRADVPGRGTWYRVRMGSFPTKDAASRYLQDFKRETRMDAFVAANN